MVQKSLHVALKPIIWRKSAMKTDRFALPLLVLLAVTLTAAVPTVGAKQAAAADDNKPVRSEAPEPRAKNGKKLLTALDLMKVATVSAPRIAPEGARVAYTASE